MASFDRINAGDVLYDVRRYKAGNTTLSRLGCWTVQVIAAATAEKVAP